MAKVEWQGMAEVNARLNIAAAAMAGPAATQTEQKVIADTVEKMKRAAPVRSGELRNSIKPQGDNEIVAAARHAVFVEFGTSDTPSQPFFRPALHESEQELPKTAATIYRRVVPGLHA